MAGVALPSGCTVEAEQVAQVDSKDMGPEVWRALLQAVARHLGRAEVRGIVVTHGTDTLEETAFLLQRTLSPAKPVVLVSAMRPATAPQPDGPQNLADGLAIAARPGASGVVAVCASRLHSAWDVRKVHNHRLDAFDSGEAGALGVLEAGRCRLWRPWPAADQAVNSLLLDRLLSDRPWPRVEWITSHAGASGWMVRALVAQSARDPEPIQGLVVAGTGNGTLHASLEAALAEAQDQGVTVWVTTRCAWGEVIPVPGSRFPTTHWPPAKARLELMFQLLEREDATAPS